MKSRNRVTITFLERQKKKKEIVDFRKKEKKITEPFQKKDIIRRNGRWKSKAFLPV